MMGGLALSIMVEVRLLCAYTYENDPKRVVFYVVALNFSLHLGQVIRMFPLFLGTRILTEQDGHVRVVLLRSFSILGMLRPTTASSSMMKAGTPLIFRLIISCWALGSLLTSFSI